MSNRTSNATDASNDCQRHILVVDDEKAIRRLAKRIFNSEGYRVTMCASGSRAVDVYAKLRDQIDLVILDMFMPDMDGLETLRQLKQMNPTVRAILCSAYIPDLGKRTIKGEGFVGFIAKPFELIALLTLAQRHLE